MRCAQFVIKNSTEHPICSIPNPCPLGLILPHNPFHARWYWIPNQDSHRQELAQKQTKKLLTSLGGWGNPPWHSINSLNTFLPGQQLTVLQSHGATLTLQQTKKDLGSRSSTYHPPPPQPVGGWEHASAPPFLPHWCPPQQITVVISSHLLPVQGYVCVRSLSPVLISLLQWTFSECRYSIRMKSFWSSKMKKVHVPVCAHMYTHAHTHKHYHITCGTPNHDAMGGGGRWIKKMTLRANP